VLTGRGGKIHAIERHAARWLFGMRKQLPSGEMLRVRFFRRRARGAHASTGASMKKATQSMFAMVSLLGTAALMMGAADTRAASVSTSDTDTGESGLVLRQMRR
jgi:hypothetical protein